MKVEITMEKIMRVSMEFDVTDEQLKQLKDGENPFWDDLEKEIEHGNTEYDYAVDDLSGREIVGWSN